MDQITKEFISFINNSVSSFHTIDNIKKILLENGFQEMEEKDDFNIELGKKYFITRNNTSIIAFDVGAKVDENYHFQVVASHSDSPSFKIKPDHHSESCACSRVLVEGYGGMICSTWLDRPLSFAGRVILENNNTIESRLVNIDKDLLIIPNVPIHFNREINSGYKYNLATDLIPVLSMNPNLDINKLIAQELKINENQIIGHDLYLYNRQKASIIGGEDEFIASGRLDDLECAFTSLKAFINGNNQTNINVYYVADNEEVGSSTAQGADSTFLEDMLYRINKGLHFSKTTLLKAIAKGFLVSADNAHALHPNHPELYDSNNVVYINKGIVIKYNASQSYTTDGLSSAVFKKILSKHQVPYQEFTNKANIRGGSTLGNISTSHVSFRSIDIGLAQWAMHSCYEVAGVKDLSAMVAGLKAFYCTNIITLDNTRIDLK